MMVTPFFGRLTNPPDGSDANFSARALLPRITPELPPSKYWVSDTLALDQGAVSAAVGFCAARLRRTDPLPEDPVHASRDIDLQFPGEEGSFQCSAGDLLESDRLGYYYYALCKEKDGHEGPGTWARVACSVLREEGVIGAYLWAHTPEEFEQWIMLRGPIMVGLNWYEGMMEPDEEGIVRLTGEIVSSHQVLVRGLNLLEGRYLIANSWGAQWGQLGDCWIAKDDLHRLVFDESGDAICPTEIPTRDLIGWNA